MITEVNAANFQEHLGDLLTQVESRNDTILMNRDGKPIAALVDAELFGRIRRIDDRFDAISGEIAEAYAFVSMNQGLAEIDAVIAEERAS